VFEATHLDRKNWVVDFGGLKDIKEWLFDIFDHKTLVAIDDPQITIFRELAIAKIIDIVEVDHVGCEKFSELVFDYVSGWLESYNQKLVGSIAVPKDWNLIKLVRVEIHEHGGNSAICKRAD